MPRGLAVLLSIGVGGLVALQAPINSLLGKRVGSLQAATVSFLVGTVALAVIALLFASGPSSGAGLRGAPVYYFAGGLLGAAYVASALVTVRVLGAGGVSAAIIAGQLAMSVIIDRVGVLGLPERPLTASRLLGVGLLIVGVLLVVRR